MYIQNEKELTMRIIDRFDEAELLLVAQELRNKEVYVVYSHGEQVEQSHSLPDITKFWTNCLQFYTPVSKIS